MATFHEAVGEPLVTCPYNPHHKVRPSALQKHMLKCPCKETALFRECPYDYGHKVRVAEYEDHIQMCSSGRALIRQIAEENQSTKIKEENATTDSAKSFKPGYSEVDEWNNDGYDPYGLPKLRLTMDQKIKHALETGGWVDPLVLRRMKPHEKRQYYRRQVEATRRATIEKQPRMAEDKTAPVFVAPDSTKASNLAEFVNADETAPGFATPDLTSGSNLAEFVNAEASEIAVKSSQSDNETSFEKLPLQSEVLHYESPFDPREPRERLSSIGHGRMP